MQKMSLSCKDTCVFAALLSVSTFMGTSFLLAQEKCFSDSKKEILDWAAANDGQLILYAEKMEKARKDGKNPANVWVKYSGVDMPLNLVYELVRAKYGKESQVVVEKAVDKSRSCAKDVQLPRAAYDVARDYLGLTTVLPEAATRVDFAQIKDGNVLGSSDALVPKGLEDARKTAEKALNDIEKSSGKALEDAEKALGKAAEDVLKAADPSNWF
jgi:hypothetical protein